MQDACEGQFPLPPYTPTIPAMLRHLANLYGDREALLGGQTRVTFNQLERRSAALARGLLASGVGKGTRLGLLLPNGPEFVLHFMAAARIGAIVAPFSTLYQPPELQWVLRHADIQVLIACDAYLGHNYLARLEVALPGLERQAAGGLALKDAPYLRSILIEGACDRAWGEPAQPMLIARAAGAPVIDDAFLKAVEAEVVPADSLCMIHTSGSTANPKGVVHGHGPLIRHSYRMGHSFWGAGGGDRLLSKRPFFWVAGLSATLFHSLHTGCCLITPVDQSAATTLWMIENEGVTAITGDDTWFRTMAADPDLRAAGYEVHKVSTDCAAIAVRTADGVRFLNDYRKTLVGAPGELEREAIPGAFGMTETLGSHSSMPAWEALPPGRPRYNGRAAPGVILRIVDPKTREPLPPGEIGELLVGGESLMQALYKRERADTFTADGLYPTGDLVSIAKDGFVLFSSRANDMVKIKGANVAPLEVEACLHALPHVQRAVVVGVGQRETMLVAAVQVEAGQVFDEDAARAVLRTRLSSYKVPKRVFVLAPDEFPLTGSGKIRKPQLAELLAERLRSVADASPTV